MKRFVTLALLLGFALAQPSAPPVQKMHMRQGAMTAAVKSERDFIQGMIPHHQEAVASARVVAENSKRPQLRAFAEEMVEIQTREIEKLRGWLGAWYPDAPKPSHYSPMMRALPDAIPDEADRAFIRDMVTHHEMAVQMAEQLLAAKFFKHTQTEALAQDIAATQTAQIATLRGWLRSWYSARPATKRANSGTSKQ